MSRKINSYWNEGASARIPVKYVDGKWEYFYGDMLPIQEGTLGELIIPKNSINDKSFLDKVNNKTRHKILPKGSKLLVALTIRLKTIMSDDIRKHLCRLSHSEFGYAPFIKNSHLSPDTQFIKITVGDSTDRQLSLDSTSEGGVWLEIEGLQPKRIKSSGIELPENFSDVSANSLNHAFTLLSAVYEPWRQSHTGNIYSRMFYQEINKKWYPLDVLRNAAIAKDEHELIKKQWEEIKKKLNLDVT